MTYAEALSKMMEDGTESLWRNVAAMPEDKISWKPEETSRSTRELLEELANTLGYTTACLAAKDEPKDFAWGDLSAKSLQELEEMHRMEVKKFCEQNASLSDEDLAVMVTLPWGHMSLLQVSSYAYWNLMYHLGQIAYIQTLYGDKEMH